MTTNPTHARINAMCRTSTELRSPEIDFDLEVVVIPDELLVDGDLYGSQSALLRGKDDGAIARMCRLEPWPATDVDGDTMAEQIRRWAELAGKALRHRRAVFDAQENAVLIPAVLVPDGRFVRPFILTGIAGEVCLFFAAPMPDRRQVELLGDPAKAA